MPTYGGQLQKQVDAFQRQGLQHGRQNLPSSNALANDQIETKLQAEATGYILGEQALFSTSIADIEKQLSIAEQKLAEFEIHCASLDGDNLVSDQIEHHMSADRHTLVDLRVTELSLRADLNGFKAVNGINNQAHYPDDMLLHLAWIFLCMALETVINAFFFENEGGLLGGAVYALAISVVNLGLAGVFGYFFRFVNHSEFFAKLWGVTCLILFLLHYTQSGKIISL